MFSHLLKTRLGKAGLVGGLSLLVATVGLGLAIQPGQGSPDVSQSYLNGSWMLSVIFPNGSAVTASCMFTSDLTASTPQGSMTCSGTQRTAFDGQGLVSPGGYGSWQLNEDGSFDWNFPRLIFSAESEATILGQRSVVATFEYADEDGSRILVGSGKLLVQGPEGEVLQTVPGIQLRAEPIPAQLGE